MTFIVAIDGSSDSISRVRPVLFRLGGIEIRSYDAFLFIGLTFGIIAGTRAGSARGLDPNRLYLALLLLSIPALIGSRLLYVFIHWRLYRDDLTKIWSRKTGGAALYGGLLLALAVSWPVLRIFGLPFGAFWDAAAITLLVGMASTKIGCLLNGCCAGRATRGWLGLNLPNENGVWQRRIPAQLLEGGLAVALLIGANAWTARPFDGALFLTALAIYAAARIPLGFTREIVDRVGGVRVLPAVSLMLLIVSTAALMLMS